MLTTRRIFVAVVVLSLSVIALPRPGAALGPTPTAAATAGCVPAPRGLVGWWPGDGSAEDIAGAHPSELVGGTGFAAGVVGPAFVFDGVDDLVSVADSPDWTLRNHGFSILLWVRLDAISARESFVGHDEGGGEFRKWIFWYDENGHRPPAGPARFHINSPTQGPLDGLYIDGRLVQTEIHGDTILDPAAPLRLGHSEEDFFLHGSLDEVQFFDRRLRWGEIAAIHTAGSAGVCKP